MEGQGVQGELKEEAEAQNRLVLLANARAKST